MKNLSKKELRDMVREQRRRIAEFEADILKAIWILPGRPVLDALHETGMASAVTSVPPSAWPDKPPFTQPALSENKA